MDKLSISFISFNYYLEQGSTHLFGYSMNLARMGHRVHAIIAGRQGEKSFEVINGVKIQRITVKNTNRRSLENIRFSFLANRILREKMSREILDIVHIFSYGGSILVKLGNRISKETKWVYDIKSGPMEDSDKPSKLYQIFKFYQKIESSFFDATFFIDKALRKLIFGSGYRARSFIIPIGVDLRTFRDIPNQEVFNRYGIDDEYILLIYLGSLARRRRIKHLIEAFWESSKTIEKIRLIILGEGDSLADLKSLVRKKKISDKIFFLGFINYFQVPKFLAAADIGISYVPIITSFDAQPPLKTMEYLACGLPVIATETIGNKRFIINDENGLITKDDPYSVSKAITRLCIDINLRNKLSRNARNSIIEYDWINIVKDKLLPAYMEIINN